MKCDLLLMCRKGFERASGKTLQPDIPQRQGPLLASHLLPESVHRGRGSKTPVRSRSRWCTEPPGAPAQATAPYTRVKIYGKDKRGGDSVNPSNPVPGAGVPRTLTAFILRPARSTTDKINGTGGVEGAGRSNTRAQSATLLQQEAASSPTPSCHRKWEAGLPSSGGGARAPWRLRDCAQVLAGGPG